MPLKLKFPTSNNPRLEPLFEGAVKPEGIDLEIERNSGRAAELFQYNLRHDDLEVSEMSLSESLISRERRDSFGQGKWDWSFIPVFYGRGMNWDSFSVLDGSPIKTAADLKGKRVAVRDYSMTALLCFRALLKDLYGIEASDIAWYNLGTRGLETGLDKQPPRGIELHWLAGDVDSMQMLKAGELDAVHGLQGNPPGTRALFPRGPRELAVQHFQATGVQHINHHYIIQNRILQKEPWVARALYDALAESGRIALDRARKYAPAYLYYEARDFAEQDAIYGPGPYPSGIEANRKTLDRLCLASYEQGLITTQTRPEDLYAPGTLDT